MHPAAEILQTIVKAIVKYPEAVSIEHTNDEKGILLTLTVEPSDMGIVIGRAGTMIDRIRLIVKTVGIKHQGFVSVKVTDPRAVQQ